MARIVTAAARGLTGREVRVHLGSHEADLIIDELNLEPPPLWNGPSSSAQAADEVIDVAFELGEIAQRNFFNPLGFGLDAAKAITDSIDRWISALPDAGITELQIGEAASVAAHKLADPRLPAALLTASCSSIRLRSRSIVLDAIDITFGQVAVTGSANSEELADWLRVAEVEVPPWATMSIESDNTIRLRHRRFSWLPQLVVAVDVVDGVVVVELNQIILAGKLLMMPKSTRKKWTVAPSQLGLSFAVEGVSTNDDLITLRATQPEWIHSTSLEQLQKLSLDLQSGR